MRPPGKAREGGPYTREPRARAARVTLKGPPSPGGVGVHGGMHMHMHMHMHMMHVHAHGPCICTCWVDGDSVEGVRGQPCAREPCWRRARTLARVEGGCALKMPFCSVSCSVTCGQTRVRVRARARATATAVVEHDL